MLPSDEQITIPLKVYGQLLHESRLLAALEAIGVDSWEGYEAALAFLEEGE